MASPRQVGKKWYVCYRDLSGGQHTLAIPAKSEAEAEKTARQFDEWLAHGIDPIRIRATFKEVTEAWFTAHVIPNCTWKTRRDYQSAFECYHLRRWSRTTMSKITKFDYQKARDAIAATGISNKRVNNVMVPCNTMFAWAAAEGYIFENPADNLIPLSTKDSTEEMRYFTPERLQQLVEACEAYDGFYRPHILFLGWTGLRMAELQELRFRDICWESDGAKIHVQRALKDGKNLVGLPKSGKKRWVGVPVHIEPILRQQEARFKTSNGDLVFPSVSGGRFDQANLRTRVFHPALVKLGWREPDKKRKRPKNGEGVRVGRGYCPRHSRKQSEVDVAEQARVVDDTPEDTTDDVSSPLRQQDYRLHDLRHTFAYIFLNRGRDSSDEGGIFALKETMGHASITTTMKYSHFGKDDAARVARSLDYAWNSMNSSANPNAQMPSESQGV